MEKSIPTDVGNPVTIRWGGVGLGVEVGSEPHPSAKAIITASGSDVTPIWG